MSTSRRFGSMDAALNFVDGQPINVIRVMLAEFLVENQPEKIILTEEQFKAFFRIRGINENGEKENRGRKKNL